MGGVTIRGVVDTDVPGLARLRQLWTQETDGVIEEPGFEERFAAWTARTAQDRRVWVAECDSELVGMINMAVFERMPRPGRPPARWGYLANAFVLQEFRNAGVGKLLIDELLAYARAQNFARVVLSPSERAVPFYERAGFGPADMLMAQTL
jgi:GNAT superfamily N-acetyltransferase